MASIEREIRSLASYLCVTCGKLSFTKDQKVPTMQIEKGSVTKGLASIASYLTKNSKMNEMLGTDNFQKAVVNQWLEYRVSQIDCAINEKDINSTLKELNEYLCEKVYLLGFSLSVADIVLYYGLHNMFMDLTFLQKQQYIHLSRWFNQVQHLPGVYNNVSYVHFQKNLIYPAGAH